MSAEWSRAAVLTRLEFLACWDALDLGDTPVALRIPEHGRTLDQRARVLAAALDGPRARGLVEEDGPGARLAGALRLLARSDHQLDLHLGGPAGTVAGHRAEADEHAAVVAQRGDQLRVVGVPGRAVAGVLIGLAGPLVAGKGRAVNIPAELLEQARVATGPDDLWGLADELVARGVARDDASSLARMGAGVLMAGQLGATFWAEGVPLRAPWVIGFHLARGGWFSVLRRPSPGGPTVQVAPVDGERLHRHLRELLDHTPIPVTRA